MLTDTDFALDFAAIWNERVRRGLSGRWHEPTDLAFWERQAERYDETHVATPNTVATLKTLLTSDMTLLDVGAGTGRYAVELADHVHHVTALDASQAMLGRLEQKRVAAGIKNISPVQASLETTDLPPHDTVLAAWSLYRSTDLLANLRKLLALSGQQLIILEDDGQKSPHTRLRRLKKPTAPAPLPKYLYVLGALWQLGVRADLQVIEEQNEMIFQDEDALVLQLFLEAEDEDKSYFLNELAPYLRDEVSELRYRYPFEVALIHVPPSQLERYRYVQEGSR